LLPDETLSVSEDAERSWAAAAAAAGSEGERDVVESNAMERRSRWTAARMESLRSRLQSRLRARGSDALGFAAGHRCCGRVFSASGTDDTLFRRSGVGPRRIWRGSRCRSSHHAAAAAVQGRRHRGEEI
jgi:hypothetical protein